MPQPLRIALMIFVAAGVLGFIVLLFWRALRRSEEPVRLIVKWLITFLIVGWVVYEGRRAQGGGGLAAMRVKGASRSGLKVRDVLVPAFAAGPPSPLNSG